MDKNEILKNLDKIKNELSNKSQNEFMVSSVIFAAFILVGGIIGLTFSNLLLLMGLIGTGLFISGFHCLKTCGKTNKDLKNIEIEREKVINEIERDNYRGKIKDRIKKLSPNEIELAKNILIKPEILNLVNQLISENNTDLIFENHEFDKIESSKTEQLMKKIKPISDNKEETDSLSQTTKPAKRTKKFNEH